MLVYVLNQNNQPLMPCKPRKARLLLQHSKAKVISKTPFVIQLIYGSSGYKQDIALGVDSGSKHIGLSASTKKKELYSAEVALRNDIVELLSQRKALRRNRRSRKTRYRKPGVSNKYIAKGWLAPSIHHKINSHLKVVANTHKILPISKIIVETASFDIQKILHPDIHNEQYQQGDQLGFWNVREYVLFRDGYKCQGKSNCKCKILNVHHIESRKTGGDSPSNLITLCEECHKEFHTGKLKLIFKRGHSFKDAAFMGIMRWTFYNKLKELYTDVQNTFGYITKNQRINLGLSKEHRIDAYCIVGNINAKKLDGYYQYKFVRKHNRQIHKCTILKGGIRKKNQSIKYVYGYRLFDKVTYNGQECFIFGRRSSGSFDIRKLDGTKISAGVSYRKLQLIEKSKTLLIERRKTG